MVLITFFLWTKTYYISTTFNSVVLSSPLTAHSAAPAGRRFLTEKKTISRHQIGY